MSGAATGLEIAVVGMAGRFPGADSVDALWRNVVAGREALTSFSYDELAAAGVPADERNHPDYVPVAGVLSDVAGFDAEHFGYSPRDAALIDPQQRVFLECVWEALEAAGHLASRPEELVGVYAGSSVSTYLLHNLLGNPSLAASVSEYEMLLGNDKDSIAARVAYHLDLRGPAVCVQTACSSSLVAIHSACQALLAQECDVAVAGGVHVRVPTHAGYRYESGGIMSRDGHCRPFEASASGTVAGSGAGAVVLRRLADALADGDTVYAVVKGTAVNNDGGVKIGYTAPSVDGQNAVIGMAQDAAEVDPDTIAYVETHGTATALGDQIELRALADAFGSRTTRKGYCALGALKALIGHLDAAAGVAGFIKACLALHHGVIPPSPYFAEPHAELELAAGPFFVNAEPLPWPRGDDPPRAAVSSFGIGGTNAHAVLEAAPAAAPAPSERADHLLVLSARTSEALGEMRERVAAALLEGDAASLADAAYTLQATRRTFPHRLAVVCRDRDEAAAALAGERSAAVRRAVEERTDGTVAFLFPGQGAQHPQMAAGLYRGERAFREPFDACAGILAAHGVDLAALVYPDGDPDTAAARLRRTAFTQPALFAVEYALAQLWTAWGIRPAAMAGHSIGEYVAACLAGVFTLEDALAAVVARGRLMEQAPAGAMLAVHLPAAEVEPLLPDGVSLAADNAPRLSVVAGDTTAVAAVAARLRERQVDCRELHTSHAFHSPALDPVLEPFAERLRGVALRAPRIPIASTVTGRWLSDVEATDPAYWTQQLRRPVRFGAAAALLLDSGHDLLEVGPGTGLATLARQQEVARGRTIVSSLSHPGRPRPDGAAIADALGRLWLGGVGIDWHSVWAGEQRRRLPLPTYPFQRTRHWVDAPGAAVDRVVDEPEPGAATGAAAAPAATQAVDTIRNIWVELLGVPDIGEHDNFFELGGHSLLGTKVVARIRDALGVDLAPSAVFEWPTVAELAAAVEAAAVQPVAAGREEPDLVPDLLDEILSMSPEELRERLQEERE